MPSFRRYLPNSTGNPEFLTREDAMTAELVIAVVTCISTVINTVIVVLSYLKNK